MIETDRHGIPVHLPLGVDRDGEPADIKDARWDHDVCRCGDSSCTKMEDSANWLTP